VLSEHIKATVIHRNAAVQNGEKNHLELQANLKIKYQHSFTPLCISFCKTYERGNNKCNIYEKVKVY
jgi:hypothetical protein